MFCWIDLHRLGSFEGNILRPSDDQREVGTASGLISSVHNLTILQDGDACRAAAHIHDRPILQVKQGIGSRWLIDHGGAPQPGRFDYIGHGPHLNLGHTWRVAAGSMGQLSSQPPLHALLHRDQQVDRLQVLNYQAIPHHLGKLVLTCQGLFVLIEHGQHQVSSAQVHAHVQRSFRGFSQRRGFRIRDPADDLFGVS